MSPCATGVTIWPMTLLQKLRERLGALRRNRAENIAAGEHEKDYADEMERKAFQSSYPIPPPDPGSLPGP